MIKPGYVSIRCSDRSSRYKGLTIEICGNIVTARMNAMIGALPRNSRRASAYAASVPTIKQNNVVVPATTSELRMGVMKSRSVNSA